MKKFILVLSLFSFNAFAIPMHDKCMVKIKMSNIFRQLYYINASLIENVVPVSDNQCSIQIGQNIYTLKMTPDQFFKYVNKECSK